MAGCCFGKACIPGQTHPWLQALAVQFPLVTDKAGEPLQMFNYAYWEHIQRHLIGWGAEAPLPVVPVQLFESVGNFTICLVLVWVWRRRRFSGQTATLYLILYSTLRIGLEFLRGDSGRGLHFGGSVSTAQIIAAATLAAAVALWWWRRDKGLEALPAADPHRNEKYSPPEPAKGGRSGSRRRRHR
jgi:phosphatidylglycerol:prolipoprotein diacylglycerol transferase